MANSIVLTIPHRLGAEEAKKRISERIELLRQDFLNKIAHSEAKWRDGTADLRIVILGQTVTGTICVMSDSVRIEVQLPWLLAALTGKIQAVLQNNAEEALRIGHSPPKA